MEVEIHAASLADEGEETFRSVPSSDVDALGGDHVKVLTLYLL